MAEKRKESVLLQALLERYTDRNCELFYPTMFSRLDRFSSWGSATGVIPTIDFPNVRRFLLNVLADLTTGEWLSTASLVAFLKKHHRYFLIPEKPQIKNKWETNTGRYDNFHEGDPYASRETTIKPSDPDAFERAEGRYVERFLEWIPNLLGYVDVAYGDPLPKTRPSLGAIPAFRVSERLRRVFARKIAEPTVRRPARANGSRAAACGLCEMLHSPATPARVAIAEWVELARSYSGEPMRRLMNGVLGRIARDVNATRQDTPAPGGSQWPARTSG